MAASPQPPDASEAPHHQLVTDLTISASPPPEIPLAEGRRPQSWRRIDKELSLHTSWRSTWLFAATANVQDMTAQDLVVVDIRIGKDDVPADQAGSGRAWESRPGGIWLLRSNFSGTTDDDLTDVDLLFGPDAVDPRPSWKLIQSPLQLNMAPAIPVARLTVQQGRPRRNPKGRVTLRVNEDGTFKIVQISDTHMVTGAGTCKDAIDADGKPLPECDADVRTMALIGKILDVEKPDLVVLTGDQLHHGISDSQTALFKVVAPIIQRCIPFAAVFGNHDDEGQHALSRRNQMSILESLPFSLCEPGPGQVDGTGNFYLQVFDTAPSGHPLATIYFLDSHGQKFSFLRYPDYEPIKQSQIDWFRTTSQRLRGDQAKNGRDRTPSLSLVFFHIPLPEFGDKRIKIRSGHRGEPTEGPGVNTHFYDALLKEGISAVGCGHDHVNDFCAVLPSLATGCQDNGEEKDSQQGPWLCYGGSCGFGAYGSYGKDRFLRRARVWEIDTRTASLKTWKRVEYAEDRVGELVLVENGQVAEVSCSDD